MASESKAIRPRDEILRDALALNQDDRAFVADELEQSLVDENSFAGGEFADAWSDEINRRIAANERGETKAIGHEEAIESIRAALASRRASGESQ
jgi:hypothetical protein